jgi:hypothetical protein
MDNESDSESDPQTQKLKQNNTPTKTLLNDVTAATAVSSHA